MKTTSKISVKVSEDIRKNFYSKMNMMVSDQVRHNIRTFMLSEITGQIIQEMGYKFIHNFKRI